MNDLRRQEIWERCKDLIVAALIGAAALCGILGVVSTARSGPDDDALAALALAQAQAALKPAPKVSPAPAIDNGNTYAGIMADCLKNNCVGVVFVGTYGVRELSGLGLTREFRTVQVYELPGYYGNSIVICEPFEGSMVWKATLPFNAPDAEIKEAIEGGAKEASRQASPFRISQTITRGRNAGSC